MKFPPSLKGAAGKVRLESRKKVFVHSQWDGFPERIIKTERNRDPGGLGRALKWNHLPHIPPEGLNGISPVRRQFQSSQFCRAWFFKRVGLRK